MLRFIPLFTIVAACAVFEDHDYDEFPDPVCGDGVTELGEQCDDANTEDGDHCSSTCRRTEVFTVHWRTSSVSGAVRTCPDGFDLAHVILEPTTDSSSQPIVFTFACEDAAGRVSAPPSDDYLISVELASSTTGEIFGRTLPQPATAVTDAIMYVDSGFASIEWTLESPDGEPRRCEVDDVTVKLTRPGLLPTTLNLVCADLHALTPPLLAGTYDLELTSGQRVVTRSGIEIEARSTLTEVAPLRITLPL